MLNNDKDGKGGLFLIDISPSTATRAGMAGKEDGSEECFSLGVRAVSFQFPWNKKSPRCLFNASDFHRNSSFEKM